MMRGQATTKEKRNTAKLLRSLADELDKRGTTLISFSVTVEHGLGDVIPPHPFMLKRKHTGRHDLDLRLTYRTKVPRGG